MLFMPYYTSCTYASHVHCSGSNADAMVSQEHIENLIKKRKMTKEERLESIKVCARFYMPYMGRVLIN